MDNRAEIRNYYTRMWQKKHRRRARHSQYKSYTKSFILKMAGVNDLNLAQERVNIAMKKYK